MTTFAPPTSPAVLLQEHNARISRVPYLPGLDGMRALAVVAVMIYHANSSWLPGGFLGVEMFFVISGYLITLLIIAERERTYRVSLVDFWKRRARRLLPALFLLLLLVTVYTAIFERDALGQLRGDVVAGTLYGSNWYQLFVGLGYTAAFDFAPLRHLWSLAVEEQFYLIWPIVMVVLLGRRGTRKIANVSRWLFLAAVAIALITAVLYHPGVIGEPEQTPEAYWWIAGRSISKLDFLYIGSFSRASGILLGAAFAMLWRPFAVMRGPLRTKGPLFDVVALLAIVGFGWMCWNIYLVTPEGAADGRLFRGGLFLSSALTILVIAAVSHPGARSNRVLGNRLLVWIGVRSYGLYLYHWPIYQAIRKLAGNKLTVGEFAFAMVLTVIVTELSFRFVETPIRRGEIRDGVRRLRISPNPGRRRAVIGGVATATVLSLFAGATLATAELRQSTITEDLDTAQAATVDLAGDDAFADVPTPEVIAPDAPDNGEPAVAVDPGGAPDVAEAPIGTPDGNSTVTSVNAGDFEPVAPNSVDQPIVDQPIVDPAVPAPSAVPADPASTVVGVPGTTVPPPVVPVTTVPAPPPPVQLGIVNDLAAVTPLGIPASPLPVPPAIPIIALGDSVMLGAAEELTAKGIAVDAVKSRQLSSFLPRVQEIRDNQRFGSIVIVHLGTNGPFPQTSLDTLMGTLAEVPIVLVVTGKADREWVDGNNQKIRALPGSYSNVTVIDWEVLGSACPDDCFYDDQIHLNQAGQNYYTDVISRVIGI